MRPAADVEEFLRDPVGRYISGAHYLIWVHSPSLLGSVYFGRPDEDDFPALLRMFELPKHPALAPPYDVVVDFGALAGVTLSSFELVGSNIAFVSELASRVGRVAVVRPSGLWGATVTGVFYEKVAPRFRATLFSDRAEAFSWLAHPDGAAARAEVDAALDGPSELPFPLRRLRDLLVERPNQLDLAAAARVLGISTRSLQRALRDAGTTFRAEVVHARVRAAEALLLDGGGKLEAVAQRLGYSSLAHFSSRFRRVTGETPGEFRARRR